MKSLLEYEGILAKSPRESLKQGLKIRLLVDGDTWVQMQESRNILAHTYNQEKALAVFQDLPIYLPKYKQLLHEITEHLSLS